VPRVLSTRTALCAALALVAFAGNSVLCRMALGRDLIDAATFSIVRLASGALMLLLVGSISRTSRARVGGSWMPALILFTYAIPFSFAYVSLTAGTGALILFGSVQVTMIAAALGSGERPHPLQWAGLVLALAGLVYLVLPGLAAPSPAGGALMALAGVSWGLYSLSGRQAADPLSQTLGNFLRALPLTMAVGLLHITRVRIEPAGVLLAALSGAIASGLGYVFWYTALGGLTATRAAIMQLTVPILAAAGGVVFIGEAISSRLVIAAIVVLGGTALALIGRDRLVSVS
jgi:drug/metabolite transporter (DMT)-like permease